MSAQSYGEHSSLTWVGDTADSIGDASGRMGESGASLEPDPPGRPKIAIGSGRASLRCRTPDREWCRLRLWFAWKASRDGLKKGGSTGDGKPDEIGGSCTLSGRFRRRGGSGGADVWCMLLLRHTLGNSPVVVGELGILRSPSTPARVGLRSGCIGGGSAGRSESGRGCVRVGEVHAETEGEVT